VWKDISGVRELRIGEIIVVHTYEVGRRESTLIVGCRGSRTKTNIDSVFNSVMDKVINYTQVVNTTSDDAGIEMRSVVRCRVLVI